MDSVSDRGDLMSTSSPDRSNHAAGDRRRSGRISGAVPRVVALVLVPFLLVACGDSVTDIGPPTRAVPVGVVVNSVELTLTVFPVDAPEEAWTIPLGPDGSPVGAAVRGNLAVVPMGIVPAAVVVDLAEGAVVDNVALPSGSGATGSAFVNDSIVLVANPGLNTVSPVNVLRGTAGEQIPVGTFPSHVAVAGEVVMVVNGELENFEPARPGTITLLDRTSLEGIGTVELSGENPGWVTPGAGGRMYVVHGGRWGQENGSLSVVDLLQAEEIAHHPGFGDFPQQAAVAGDGRLYVSSWSYGLVAWEPSTEVFARGPDDPIAPDGVGAAAGLAVDDEGSLHTLFPDCSEPSRVVRLGPGYETEGTVDVGICPSALYFVELELEND